MLLCTSCLKIYRYVTADVLLDIFTSHSAFDQIFFLKGMQFWTESKSFFLFHASGIPISCWLEALCVWTYSQAPLFQTRFINGREFHRLFDVNSQIIDRCEFGRCSISSAIEIRVVKCCSLLLFCGFFCCFKVLIRWQLFECPRTRWTGQLLLLFIQPVLNRNWIYFTLIQQFICTYT